MKKYSLLMTILSVLLCACSSFDEEIIKTINSANTDLHAVFADGTRTYVENNQYLRWHEDDLLTVFYGNTLNRQYKFNGKTGDNSGTFSFIPNGELSTGNSFDHIYAIYPYNENTTITEEGTFLLNLPDTQYYATNSFGKGANTMVAVTENLEDTFLAFKNTCGYLKLKLYAPEGGLVKSIKVKGNNNEKIAGAAIATIEFDGVPSLTMTSEATTTITVHCGDGISLGTSAESATDFWVVIPELTFTNGLTITVTDSFNASFTQSTNKEVIIERNSIQPMTAIEFNGIKSQPNNEIWYTATEIITPSNNFGTTITSNTWDSETNKGVITFDNDVTLVGTSSFKDKTSITSISLPNSTESIGNSAFSGCTNLQRIYINNDVKTIGDSAFSGCTSLTNVSIPDSVISIGKNTFRGCTSLYKVVIPESVVTIGNYAFYQCTNLSSVFIHDTLMSIGEYAFAQSGINSIEIPNGSIATISKRAFSECDSLTNVVIGNGVTLIEDSAFRGCEQLASITLPETIKTINTHAFTDNPMLKTVFCKATTRPAIYYDGTKSDEGESFPFNSGMIIYVPRTSYSHYSYKSNPQVYGLSTTSWNQWIKYIQPYDF